MPLVASMGVKLGPIVFLTALRHFIDKIGSPETRVRDEFLYDEMFTIVKSFLEAASRHTIEELQEFANTRIPAPPAIRNVRLMVPLSSCTQAADYLIKALGGEDQAACITGGTRWWQIRGLNGIDANWIAVKKDMESAKKESLRHVNAIGGNQRETGDDKEAEYSSELDPMRCMYYIHGGGYFFGSVDQVRYSVQRYARKMKGRVFAINYRLSPQYPFPCALQDVLAGYLYLIRPPPEALHKAVHPSQIVFGGDSAGGGMALALLQIIRDAGLPLPAAAVLISPWSDLTHSFPSVFQNTATDVIPSYGLSLYRPSPLWPPPSEEMDAKVRNVLTTSVRATVRHASIASTFPAFSSFTATSKKSDLGDDESDRTTLGDTVLASYNHNQSHGAASKKLTPTISHLPASEGVPAPPKDPKDQVHSELPSHRGEPLIMQVDGQKVEIKSQIHLYAMNHQLGHPLVSPALGYLGGLPPLYIMCGDNEVLKDEIVYVAHKAAHPERYPIKESTKSLYPALVGIEELYGPTDVHLQVYDDACHDLPLFPFSTSATFCYRAVAAFCKHFVKTSPVSGSLPNMEGPSPPSVTIPPDSTDTTPEPVLVSSPMSAASSEFDSLHFLPPEFVPHNQSNKDHAHRPEVHPKQDSKSGPGMAGYPGVYEHVPGTCSPFTDHMIRERVSTRGIIRPLESEENLPGCKFPVEKIGLVNEAGAKRYLEGQALWDKKYSSHVKKVARQREKNLALAKEDNIKMMGKLHDRLVRQHRSSPVSSVTSSPSGENAASGDNNDGNLSLNSPLWNWSWALEGEDPPASSIVARRDTVEARRLSKCADTRLDDGESRVSGNNLWAIIVDHLSSPSSASRRGTALERGGSPDSDNSDSHLSVASSAPERRSPSPRRSIFERFKSKHSQGHHEGNAGSTT